MATSPGGVDSVAGGLIALRQSLQIQGLDPSFRLNWKCELVPAGRRPRGLSHTSQFE